MLVKYILISLLLSGLILSADLAMASSQVEVADSKTSAHHCDILQLHTLDSYPLKGEKRNDSPKHYPAYLRWIAFVREVAKDCEQKTPGTVLEEIQSRRDEVLAYLEKTSEAQHVEKAREKFWRYVSDLAWKNHIQSDQLPVGVSPINYDSVRRYLWLRGKAGVIATAKAEYASFTIEVGLLNDLMEELSLLEEGK